MTEPIKNTGDSVRRKYIGFDAIGMKTVRKKTS